MAAEGPSREKRVAERIRADLAALLVRGAIRDPDVQGAIVSSVDVTKDLSVAKVYVRHLSASASAPDGDVSDAQKKKLVDAMKRATGYLRRELGATLKLRRVPELRFSWDDGADHAARLDAIFDEIRADTKERGR
jgi:ribosome-binding factor A